MSNLYMPVIDAFGGSDKRILKRAGQLITMKVENLFTALWPSVTFLRVFGTNPIFLKRNAVTIGFHFSLTGVVYLLLLIGLFAYSGHSTAYYGFDAIFQPGQLVVLIIHITIRAIFAPVCAVLILLASIARAPTACRLISGLAKFPSAFPHRFPPSFYKATVCASLAVSALFFTFIIILSFIEFENVASISDGTLSPLSMFTFFVSWVSFDIVSWATVAQLLIYSGLLFHQFKTLETEVAGDLHKPPKSTSSRSFFRVVSEKDTVAPFPNNLKNLRNQYTELTFVAEDLNKVFAPQILVSVTCNTILLCFAFFILLLNLEHQENAPPLHASLIWFSVRIIPIYLTVYPFSSIQSKVDELSTTVHMWITKTEGEDKISKDLRLFANQLSVRKLHFSAHGFFELGNSTITAIFGAAISYLVILLQFHSILKNWYGDKPTIFFGYGAPSNFSYGQNVSQQYQ